MPLVGYVCPAGTEEPGRRNAPEFCLTECKAPCVVPPLLAAQWQRDTTNYHVGDYLSASMIAGDECRRRTFLERYEDFYEVPERRLYSWRGTVFHAEIEAAADIVRKYGWLQEIRMQSTLQFPHAAPVFDQGVWTGDFDSTKDLEIEVKGTCDGYNPKSRTLLDFKSMADAKIDMFVRGTMKDATWSTHLQDSWVAQLNIYRWLVARTEIPADIRAEFKGYGIDLGKRKCWPAPTRLVLQGIGMMHQPHSGMTFSYRQKGGQYGLHAIDPVPVWPMADIEEFIRPRALKWYKTLVLKVRPPVVGKDKAWLCKYCSFHNDLCFPDEERKARAAT